MRLGYVLVVLVLAGCGGSAAPRADGPTLYLAGDNELWVVDADSQTVRHENRADLEPGDPPYKVLARGRRVVMGSPYGNEAVFIPSAHPDRIWVVDLRPRHTGVLAVREVTVDGETTVPATRPPSPLWPLGAVRDGLLLEGKGGVDVWNPATGHVVETLHVQPGLVGPTSPDVVTVCTDPYCTTLRLLDIESGDARAAPAPAHSSFQPWDGAFSPDGRTFASPVRSGPRDPFRLALIDVVTGRVGLVRDSEVPGGYTLVAWSADGEHVFFTGGARGRHRVIVGYRMGTRAAQVIKVDVGDFYDFAAT
jgi:WD40 repeat protein